jgi:type IV pilus assembly protein PilV
MTNRQISIGRDRGFSLVEVLVALVVLSVGLLGIAKMQALALSSTSVASMRSLAALEAASLAAAMHENRGYWTSPAAITPVATPVQVQGNAVSNGPAAATCTVGGGAPCTPIQLAAYDLQQWANDLQALLPNDTATVTCLNNGARVDCTINISWSEKTLAINTQSQGQATTATIDNPSYTLFVEP